MFNFPEIKKEKDFKYSLNFLKTVIFHIKYNEKNISEFEKTLDETIKLSFPKRRSINKGEITLKMDKTPVIISGANSLQGFEYKTDDEKKILSVTNDSISLTIIDTKYSNFNNEFRLFNKILVDICHIVGVEEFNRVAIRKINAFDFEMASSPLDIFRTVTKEMFSQSIFSFPGNNLLGSGIISCDFEENDYKLKLSYGITPIKKNNDTETFVIDIDVFKRNSTTLDKFVSEMEKINATIFDIFDYLITDELKGFMLGGKEK